MHPKSQQLTDNKALFEKFFFKSLKPFIMSFLNISKSVITYTRSVKANKNILGILGILDIETPNELINPIKKLL